MRDLSKLGKGRLILEDGSIWQATPFGADGEAGGELVFNTAMSGYQEVLTDPSYTGQVVLMTSVEIGNYGVNDQDGESPAPRVSGFVVREASTMSSNWRATEDLRNYLRRHGIVALEGVDTRALTLRLRDRGAMKVFITSEPLTDDELRRRLAEVPDLEGQDFVAGVTCAEAHPFERDFDPGFESSLRAEGEPLRVVAFDLGAKDTIYRSRRAVGCEVEVVPAGTTAAEVLAREPDGVFLSNGPGDPRPLESITATVAALLGRVPIFGICLGHQILAQAVGAETVKMKFGHHGSNHPVKDLATGRVEITSQNHGFAVTEDSLRARGGKVTHLNLNDGSIEGFSLPDRRAFSVQYHPEAAPGPHDSRYLFERFRDLMRGEALA